MDLLFQRGRATVADVQAGIADPPSYSAVRALLRTLEEKGFATHEEEGRAYIYKPAVRRDDARRSAVSHLLTTFFGGSTEQAVAALLDVSRSRLSTQELDRMAELVKQAKREGR
jgi:predicted transcriptional regulator